MSDAARAVKRQRFDTDVRLRLLEDDADAHDARFDNVNADIGRRFDAMDVRVGKLTGIALGILVSTCTAAILLALNLVVAR